MLVGASMALALGTLYACLPGPRLVGYVLEAEIRDCSPPVESLDRAIAHWERILGGRGRPGRAEDARRSVALDPGVVLELTVARGYGIYAHRKPWSDGRLEARAWREARVPKRYHATYAGRFCDGYPGGTKALLDAPGSTPRAGGGPREWPPTSDVPGFLGLATVTPASNEHRHLVGGAAGR